MRRICPSFCETKLAHDVDENADYSIYKCATINRKYSVQKVIRLLSPSEITFGFGTISPKISSTLCRFMCAEDTQSLLANEGLRFDRNSLATLIESEDLFIYLFGLWRFCVANEINMQNKTRIDLPFLLSSHIACVCTSAVHFKWNDYTMFSTRELVLDE